MNKNRPITYIILLFLTTLLMVGCKGKDNNKEVVTWRFGHEETPGSIQDQYASKFKELVEKESHGRIKVEIYRYGEIGEMVDYLEFTEGGLLDFCILNPGTTGTTIPENNVFYNHFLMPEDTEDLKKYLKESEGIKKLNKLNEEKNLYVLDWFCEGFNAWTADKNIQEPDDFKGVKIRTMPSPLIVSSYKAYGANPTPVSYSEVYSGLQLKQIDAQVNPIFSIEEMKFYEVQDYLIQAKQDAFFASLNTSPEFYKSLDSDTKKMLKKVVNYMHDYIIDKQEVINQERLDKIKSVSDIEVVELTEEQREKFRQASLPVRKEFLKSVGSEGKEILETIEKETEKYR